MLWSWRVPFPSPCSPAVGWLHYPLHQQALLPLADPVSYWEAVETVRADLAAAGGAAAPGAQTPPGADGAGGCGGPGTAASPGVSTPAGAARQQHRGDRPWPPGNGPSGGDRPRSGGGPGHPRSAGSSLPAAGETEVPLPRIGAADFPAGARSRKRRTWPAWPVPRWNGFAINWSPASRWSAG